MNKREVILVGLFLALPVIGSMTASPKDILVVPATTITKLNPYLGNDINLNKVMNQIAANLVSLDDSLAPIPDLAQTWSVDSDKKEITFTLRDDRKFHDGSPIESKDIFQVFKKSVDGGSDLSSQLSGFKTCRTAEDCPCFKTISKRQFTLTLSDPNFPHLLRKLAGVEGVVYKTSAAYPHFIGTGPYRIKEISDDAIVTERIDPKFPLHLIVFRKVSAKSGIEEFSRGSVDLINNMEFTFEDQEVPASAKRQDLVSVTFGLVFKLSESSIFHQPEIRRAVSTAIDKAELIKGYGKRAIPADGLIPKGFLGHEDRSNKIDIEAARALVTKYVPTNRRQVVLALRDRFRGNTGFESYLKKTFKKIGLELNIHYDNFNQILGDYRKGKYDIILKGDTPRYYESSTVFIPYIHGQKQNISNFKNQELTELYYRYETTVDEKRKIGMLSRMESIIREEIPVLPLFHPVLSTWYQKNIEIEDFKKLSIRLWDFPYHKLSKQIVLKQP